MKAAKKDTSGIFDSVLVHFGKDKARFDPGHLKVNDQHPILTVPTAWHFKPLTEVGLRLEVPTGKKKSLRQIECRGIIVECRPQKKRGHYHVDLLLTHLPSGSSALFQKLTPTDSSSAVR